MLNAACIFYVKRLDVNTMKTDKIHGDVFISGIR